MKYKLIIFDMDGTILNTLDDLSDCTNYALSQSGLPTRTIDEIRSFVGNGIAKLIARSVPEGTDDAMRDKVYGIFTEYYKEHCADKTRPYDGITELIMRLRELGYKTAVVSNKADFAVQDLCVQYFDGLFDMAVGAKDGVAKKPAPDSVYEVLDKLGFEKKDAVYIGDSDVDIATADNSGLDSIIVEWGFRDRGFLIEHGAKVLVKKPEEILDLI